MPTLSNIAPLSLIPPSPIPHPHPSPSPLTPPLPLHQSTSSSLRRHHRSPSRLYAAEAPALPRLGPSLSYPRPSISLTALTQLTQLTQLKPTPIPPYLLFIAYVDSFRKAYSALSHLPPTLRYNARQQPSLAQTTDNSLTHSTGTSNTEHRPLSTTDPITASPASPASPTSTPPVLAGYRFCVTSNSCSYFPINLPPGLI